ncbi:hypothetical protein V5O48_006125, partial [Marasmius crinis-equi]
LDITNAMSESEAVQDPVDQELEQDSDRLAFYTRNPSGKNQWGKTSPLDDELEAALRDLNGRGITSYAKIMDNLRDEGFTVGRTTLSKYIKQLGLSSPRNPSTTAEERAQLVLEYLAKDPKKRKGPHRICQEMKLDGIMVTRDFVTQTMQDHDPEGFAQRVPGKKKEIRRTPLSAIGPHEEWSMDGHDKLAAHGFEIYGIRDKWGGLWIHYRVLPSNRYAIVVGVVFLEAVKKMGGLVPVRGTTDCGSETRDACAFHGALRETFAPDLLEELVPAWNFIPSYRNITIERSWRPVFETWGVNILEFYESGLYGGDYQAGNEVHDQTKNWIWYPLVQRELDRFAYQQNNLRIRKQQTKNLPSGGTRSEFYRHPERWGGSPCGITVDIGIVDHLLEKATADGADKLMQYVDKDFEGVAEAAFDAVGRPTITLHTAWRVFRLMVAAMGAGDTN